MKCPNCKQNSLRPCDSSKGLIVQCHICSYTIDKSDNAEELFESIFAISSLYDAYREGREDFLLGRLLGDCPWDQEKDPQFHEWVMGWEYEKSHMEDMGSFLRRIKELEGENENLKNDNQYLKRTTQPQEDAIIELSQKVRKLEKEKEQLGDKAQNYGLFLLDLMHVHYWFGRTYRKRINEFFKNTIGFDIKE